MLKIRNPGRAAIKRGGDYCAAIVVFFIMLDSSRKSPLLAAGAIGAIVIAPQKKLDSSTEITSTYVSLISELLRSAHRLRSCRLQQQAERDLMQRCNGGCSCERVLRAEKR